MAVQTDIREMVPRVRRALEGAGAPAVLADVAVKDIVADACASVILYTGTLFGEQLVVTHRDSATNAPDEYATTDELTLPEQVVISAQAALDYFFHQFAGMKVSEDMGDEGSSWSYTLSANLLIRQLDLLRTARDTALEAAAVINGGIGMDTYISFISERDRQTSRMIEPWVYGNDDSGYVTANEGFVRTNAWWS